MPLGKLDGSNRVQLVLQWYVGTVVAILQGACFIDAYTIECRLATATATAADADFLRFLACVQRDPKAGV